MRDPISPIIPLVQCALAAVLSAPTLASGAAADESDYYTVDYLLPPDGARIEVGGMDFLPDGRLAVSTRRGQVWIVEDPLAADPAGARFHLFAEGLQEGLGLSVVDGELYVLQRGELSRLLDEDGDGTADRVDTISNEWGLSGHYHEFAFGLPRDREGNFYAGLNVSFGDAKWWHGRSTVPYRGWVMRIGPDGTTEPFASGLRSPCGLGTNGAGEVFVTDNQGDWVPACPILHLKEGGFYGHPASLNWTDEYRAADRTASDTEPPARERTPAAAWIPYDWSRSAGNLVTDASGGLFGPFANQMFVAELTNGFVLRAQLEKVRGEYQGAVFPFRSGVGSANRVCFGPDGTLFTGLTERGWGGQAPGDGIARVRWTGSVPLEMQSVHLLQDGFEIEFTLPLRSAPQLGQVHLSQYDYDYWWEYGSPPRNSEELEVTSIELSDDRRTAIVRAQGLQAGKVARLNLDDVFGEDGAPLLHGEMAYTINQLPGGPIASVQVAKEVEPPAAREKWDEGVLMLLNGKDPLDVWRAAGWRVALVMVDLDFPDGIIDVKSPESESPDWVPIITNEGAARSGNMISDFEFSDCDMHVEFMLPQGGDSGVFLMGRYEVQISDGVGNEEGELTFEDCGGIYTGFGLGNRFAGRAPNFKVFKGPGEWHSLDIKFRAPRFDRAGVKTENAKFLRVMIDDVLLHEEVEVVNPTKGSFGGGEAAWGPLMIDGKGLVAIRNLRILDRSESGSEEGWVPIFDGESLDGWKVSDGGQWKVEDGAMVGTGAPSHIFSPRDDYVNFELRAKVKINEGGNSGMYFRATYGEGWPQGYEAQVNSTNADPVKTGSLYNLDIVRTQLIPVDTWFTQHVLCRETEEGTRIVIRLNGIVVTDHLDQKRLHAQGHVALQQHHEGSIVHYKDVEVREWK